MTLDVEEEFRGKRDRASSETRSRSRRSSGSPANGMVLKENSRRSKAVSGLSTHGYCDNLDNPHQRSHSVKTMKRPCYLELDFRPRTSSMPSRNTYSKQHASAHTYNDEDIYRLRSFTITSKGVINRGDSIKSRSNNSVASTSSSHSGESRDRTSSVTSQASTGNSGTSSGLVRYKVLILGAPGVGKTALTTQFMTSEYMNAYDANIDDHLEKSVSVLLDGEESELDFTDLPSSILENNTSWPSFNADAYVVSYSITDRGSFQQAVDILFGLRVEQNKYKAVILVANKTDLVRSRVISSEEGKALATSYDCKFIETSAGLNHHVDELLVGILSQIRLKQALKITDKISRKKNDCRRSHSSGCTRASRLLNKIFQKKQYFMSKSCDNLHVL